MSVSFVFICSILQAGEGEFKVLNFQVACAQQFQTRNDFLRCQQFQTKNDFLRCQQIWNVVINL